LQQHGFLVSELYKEWFLVLQCRKAPATKKTLFKHIASPE